MVTKISSSKVTIIFFPGVSVDQLIKLRCSRLHRDNISKPECVSLTWHTHTNTLTYIYMLQGKPDLVPERLGRVNQITGCGVKWSQGRDNMWTVEGWETP